jgi:hypothetical protein
LDKTFRLFENQKVPVLEVIGGKIQVLFPFFRFQRGSNQTVFYNQMPDILGEKNLILQQFHELILSDYFG